jgi:hypothetical protein
MLEDGGVEVTFLQSGPLGLKFKRAVGAGGHAMVRVDSIREGTVAATLSLLTPGLLLARVDGVDVRARSYDEAVALVKAAPRPFTLTLEPPVPQAATAPDRQQHNVIFDQEGSLGIKFKANAAGGLKIDSIREGSVAASVQQLQPGMVLLSLSSSNGSMSVVNMSKKEALAALKAASRPLELNFEPASDPIDATNLQARSVGSLTAGAEAAVAAASAVIERGEKAESAQILSAAAAAVEAAEAAAHAAGVIPAGTAIRIGHPEEDTRLPLHEAAAAGDQSRVLELLRQGADAAELDRSGGTAFHVACRTDEPFAAIQLLFGGCPREAADREGLTGAELAARHQSEQVLAALSTFDELVKEESQRSFRSLPLAERWSILTPRFQQRLFEMQQERSEKRREAEKAEAEEARRAMAAAAAAVDALGATAASAEERLEEVVPPSSPKQGGFDWSALLPTELEQEVTGHGSFDQELSRAQIAVASPEQSLVSSPPAAATPFSLPSSNEEGRLAVEGWLQRQGLAVQYADAIAAAFEQDGEAASAAPEEWVDILESMQPAEVDQFIQNLEAAQLDPTDTAPGSDDRHQHAFAGSDEAPLAPQWVEYEDPADGTPYYYHTETGETSWERPPPAPSDSFADGVEENAQGDGGSSVVAQLRTENSALQGQVKALLAALSAQNNGQKRHGHSPGQGNAQAVAAQLRTEKMSALLRRARACGVPEYTLEQALDSDEQREAVVELLLVEYRAGRLVMSGSAVAAGGLPPPPPRTSAEEGIPPAPSARLPRPPPPQPPPAHSNAGRAAAVSSTVGQEFAEASARAAAEFRGEMARWREETARRQAIAQGKTPSSSASTSAAGVGAGAPATDVGRRGDLLGGQTRADAILKSSPILGLGLRIGRTAEGVPLESALSKIMASARFTPSTGGGVGVSLLGTGTVSGSSSRTTMAATTTDSPQHSRGSFSGFNLSATAVGGSTSRWRSPPPQSSASARGLSIFHEHTSALKAQLQDLHRSLEEPVANWDTAAASISSSAGLESAASTATLDGVAAAAILAAATPQPPPPLAFSARLPLDTASGGGDSSGGGGLVLRPAAQASKATAASGRDSPPPLSGGGADAAGAPEATAVAPATDDATFRSINWSPAPIRSSGMDSSAAMDRLSVSGAGIGIGFGMGGVGSRTPGRVSPLEGVRGAALSAESSVLGGGGGGWSRRGAAAIGRTGSLSPGDDT